MYIFMNNIFLILIMDKAVGDYYPFKFLRGPRHGTVVEECMTFPVKGRSCLRVWASRSRFLRTPIYISIDINWRRIPIFGNGDYFTPVEKPLLHSWNTGAPPHTLHTQFTLYVNWTTFYITWIVFTIMIVMLFDIPAQEVLGGQEGRCRRARGCPVPGGRGVGAEASIGGAGLNWWLSERWHWWGRGGWTHGGSWVFSGRASFFSGWARKETGEAKERFNKKIV